MIDKPVGDNTNTHSRATLLIINVDVWCLTGDIIGDSCVYGPAFCWGWNGAVLRIIKLFLYLKQLIEKTFYQYINEPLTLFCEKYNMVELSYYNLVLMLYIKLYDVSRFVLAYSVSLYLNLFYLILHNLFQINCFILVSF